MKKFIYILLIVSTFVVDIASAQDMVIGKPQYRYKNQWYLGKDGGVPFGVSNFSSFGSGDNKCGWSAGMYGGYFFSNAFALEAYMLTGKVKLTSQDKYANLWLSADNQCYTHQPPEGQSWQYANLRSCVKLQMYGLRTNINLLGFINHPRVDRWIIGLIPQISLVGTKAYIYSVNPNEKVMKHGTQWHFGAGGNINVGYKIAKQWSLALYSGITYLTGAQMDHIPHKAFGSSNNCKTTNYIWECGLRINYIFRPKPHLVRKVESYFDATVRLFEGEPVNEKIVEGATNQGIPYETIEFPIIEFPTNGIEIDKSQQSKMKRIVRQINRSNHKGIKVTGYANDGESIEVNRNRALQRAKAIKNLLTQANIDETLIEIVNIDDNQLQNSGNRVMIEMIKVQ